ncbi:MAG: hypothetical protein D6731_00345 [Planctomycetota bacterium]|nr:MAG: hypothetical protein D6731_00345 [Planctomycetota bacterium]
MSRGLDWAGALGLVAEACATAREGERRVLLVLADRAYHVREVLAGPGRGGEALLGFVAWADDPSLTQRSEDTCLLLVPPGQVQRLEIAGYDPHQEQRFGFAAGEGAAGPAGEA